MEDIVFSKSELKTLLEVLRKSLDAGRWANGHELKLEDRIKQHLALLGLEETLKYNRENPDKPQRG